jgi:mannose-1-phosphate guanylyltransferase
LLEPFGRNTGPAIALGAFYAESRYGADAILLALPSDHLIRDGGAFTAAVDRAKGLAKEGWIVTFGIGPTHPETGYGYIECGEPLDSEDAFRAARFVEKPPLAEAVAFLTAGSYVWNSGMFCFMPATILAAFREHAPAMYEAVRSVWQGLRASADASMLEIDAALFAAVPDLSIDYAVMEKAHQVAVIRGGFDWSDVGSWQAVSALTEPDAAGNRGQGERVAIGTRDTFVHAGDRVVATVGVDNLVIVDTPDALLVAHRDHLQRVREVVGELKARGHDTYKQHRTVARPWGAYTVLQEGPGFKIKRIEVRPGGALSLQLHHRRGEHWVVVSGEARVTNGDRVYPLKVNESTFIPIETRHRLENPGDALLVMIEVQCGDYLGEDDIVRFDDKYGRVAH